MYFTDKGFIALPIPNSLFTFRLSLLNRYNRYPIPIAAVHCEEHIVLSSTEQLQSPMLHGSYSARSNSA